MVIPAESGEVGRQRVRCPHFESLRRALAIVNLQPEMVALPGGLAPPEQHPPPPAVPRRSAMVAPPTATGNPPHPLAQNRQRNQEEEQNLYPAPQLQIRPGLRIRTEIYEVTGQGCDIPATDDGRHNKCCTPLSGGTSDKNGGRRPLRGYHIPALSLRIFPCGSVTHPTKP